MLTYEHTEPRVRRRLLPYVQSVYRRWYHSTLIENIHFSPANIADSISHYCGMSPGTHIIADITQPVSKLDKIDKKVLHYNIDSHPIAADLRRLIKICTPHIDLCEEWCFLDAQAIKVSKKLSLCDPYYASFLLEVACKMNLLTRMRSLYVQRMQVSQNASVIFKLSDRELLIQITDAVISMTSAGLQNSLPAPVPLFTEEGLRDLLINPISTDEIVSQAFAAIGYDVSMLSLPSNLTEPDEFSDETDNAADFVSGIFVLGILLDRLFFTPFGHFLRLIRHVYTRPFNIKAEIANYAYALDEAEDGFAAFFAPCTSFTLTEMGLELFKAKPTPNNYFNKQHILTREVLESVFTAPERILAFVKAAREAIPVKDMPHAIYTFCVYETDNPDTWVHIQIPKSYTLHQLYEEVLEAFYTDESDNYSFYHSKIENRFTEYSGGLKAGGYKKVGSRRNTKPVKKHTHIPLAALDFRYIGHLLLVMHYPGTTKFTLEWLNEFAPQPLEHYPCVSKLSAAAQELLDSFDNNDEDFFDLTETDFDF
jgi:hypothetical protein